jgi:hypothetical protein
MKQTSRQRPLNNTKMIKLVMYSRIPSISIGMMGKIVQFLQFARQFLPNRTGITENHARALTALADGRAAF